MTDIFRLSDDTVMLRTKDDLKLDTVSNGYIFEADEGSVRTEDLLDNSLQDLGFYVGDELVIVIDLSFSSEPSYSPLTTVTDIVGTGILD